MRELVGRLAVRCGIDQCCKLLFQRAFHRVEREVLRCIIGQARPDIGAEASIMASATVGPPAYPMARRSGLRGAGGSSTDAKMAANIERGFCSKNRSAAVVPSGRVRKKL